MAELSIEGILQLFAESDKRMEKLTQDLKLQFAETDNRMEKISREVNKKIADLGDTLGRFAEEQVRADVINKFKHWGIPVHSIADHFEMQDEDGRFVYEIDILIYNQKYVVALEVKNTLKIDDVDAHLERMKKIQTYPMPGAQGKTLLAGVAGMIVGKGVDVYAEKKGLFVLKPSGDSVTIMNDHKTFKPQEWACS